MLFSNFSVPSKQILRPVCIILEVVEFIRGIFDVFGLVAPVSGGAAFFAAKPGSGGGHVDQCDGTHGETCLDSLNERNCDLCLMNSNITCPGCFTCYRPLENTNPEMLGLCLPTEGLRDDAGNAVATQTMLMALMANYIKYLQQSTDESLRRNLYETTEGDDGAHITLIRQVQTSTREILAEMRRVAASAENPEFISSLEETDDKVTAILNKLGEGVQCSVLNEEHIKEQWEHVEKEQHIKKDDFHSAAEDEETIDQTKERLKEKFGLTDANVDDVFDIIKDTASSSIVSETFDNIKAEMKEDFMQNDVKKVLTSWALDEVNSKQHSIKTTVGEGARSQVEEVFNQILRGRGLRTEEKESKHSRHLQNACGPLLDEINKAVRDAVEEVVKFVFENIGEALNLVDTLGGAVSFGGGARDIPALFFKAVDPFADAILAILRLVSESFQRIAAICIFGCDATDTECVNRLPTKSGSPIRITEARDGTLYLTSGCNGYVRELSPSSKNTIRLATGRKYNSAMHTTHIKCFFFLVPSTSFSNFRGELVFYVPIFSFIDSVLSVAGDTTPGTFTEAFFCCSCSLKVPFCDILTFSSSLARVSRIFQRCLTPPFNLLASLAKQQAHCLLI